MDVRIVIEMLSEIDIKNWTCFFNMLKYKDICHFIIERSSSFNVWGACIKG